MKIFTTIKSISLLVLSSCLIFSACNKAPLEPDPIALPEQAVSPTLASLLDNSEFSILKAAVDRAGLLPALANTSARYTLYAPNNAAFILAGIPSVAVINALPAASVAALINYHISPQKITFANFPKKPFFNFEYPTLLNPTGSAGTVGFNPFVRLTTFPSRHQDFTTGYDYLNNIPLTDVDISAVNGTMHKVYTLVSPPSKYLWDSISTSQNLTYLKAAILRADSGEVATNQIQTGLKSFGTNLTVLAPTNLAFKTLLTSAIYQGLVLQGMPAATSYPTAQYLASTPSVFTNPALYGILSAKKVRGIVLYHILGTTIPGVRIFSVNLPSTPTPIKTLINSAIAAHPGVIAKATFSGPFVGTATFKGVANTSASKVIINPMNPFATDQNYINGVIMKIDQVLLPQ